MDRRDRRPAGPSGIIGRHAERRSPQSSVMACAEDFAGTVDDFASRFAAELGADGYFEAGFGRDIWYACLVHFAGPVERPAELVDWISGRRRVGFGTSTFHAAQLILWRFHGSGMLPHVLAEVPFTVF